MRNPAALSAALVELAARGVSPDVQELLVRGHSREGVQAGALEAAFAAYALALGPGGGHGP